MPGSIIKKGAVVRYAIVAEDTVIEEGAVVGQSPESVENIDDWGIAVIGDGLKVGKGAVVTAGKMITNDVADGETI
jgi:glucose-1-phosphate adenylyltransferase